MDKLMKRRISDAKRRVEKNKAKFISMYTEAIHGDIYREADQLYNTIRQNNPRSKDLTKTLDFMLKVTPYKPVPRYYRTKRNNHQKTPCKDNNSVMVLNIPLMEKTLASQIMSITTTTEQEETSVVQAAPEQEEETSVVQPAPEQEEGMSVVQAAPEQEGEMSVVQAAPEQEGEMSVVQAAPEQEETHLDIPDRVYVEMLEEIRKDPDLYRIFNDINTQDYHQESDDMLDSFTADDISPIEIELAQLGYE